METIQRIQQPIQWRQKYFICSLGVRRRSAAAQLRGMGLSRWAGAHDVGVCDVQWASDGLQGFKSEAVDPSKVSCTPLTVQRKCCLNRSTGSTDLPQARRWNILHERGSPGDANDTESLILHAARRRAAVLPLQAGRKGARRRGGQAKERAAVDLLAAGGYRWARSL